MVSSLANQYVSASFGSLLQISGSGKLYDGTGSLVTSIDVTSSFSGRATVATSASFAQVSATSNSSNTSTTAVSSSFATTASFSNTSRSASFAQTASFVPGVTINGANSGLVYKTNTGAVSSSIGAVSVTSVTIVGSDAGTIDLTALGKSGGNGLILPIQAPISPKAGSIYLDELNNRLMIYSSGTWRYIATSV